jgi:CheY-like chemotaxis protein
MLKQRIYIYIYTNTYTYTPYTHTHTHTRTHTHTHTHTQVALDMLKQRMYDVVLIDLNMPVMDGFETIRLFRYVCITIIDTIIHNNRHNYTPYTPYTH